jgi:hypothetical protein
MVIPIFAQAVSWSSDSAVGIFTDAASNRSKTGGGNFSNFSLSASRDFAATVAP